MTEGEKRKRGRPAGDKMERVQLTINVETMERLEARRRQEHRRTIADTARAIIERGLEEVTR
jgi:DNA transposition AAA+ family ATPase